MAAPLTVIEGGKVTAGDGTATAARSAGAASPQSRIPQLVVIAGRRRATRYVVSITMVIAGAMGGVVFLNTKLASRQIEINEIDSQLADELTRFDELRAQRAELRAPARLEPLAQDAGMVPVEESEYAEVDPWVYARQLALNGRVPSPTGDTNTVTRASDPMEQYRAIKQLIEEGP